MGLFFKRKPKGPDSLTMKKDLEAQLNKAYSALYHNLEFAGDKSVSEFKDTITSFEERDLDPNNENQANLFSIISETVSAFQREIENDRKTVTLTYVRNLKALLRDFSFKGNNEYANETYCEMIKEKIRFEANIGNYQFDINTFTEQYNELVDLYNDESNQDKNLSEIEQQLDLLQSRVTDLKSETAILYEKQKLVDKCLNAMRRQAAMSGLSMMNDTMNNLFVNALSVCKSNNYDATSTKKFIEKFDEELAKNQPAAKPVSPVLQQEATAQPATQERRKFTKI